MQFLHLGWDHDLRNEEISDRLQNNYLATTLSIGLLRSKQVAHFCLTVFEANRTGIPYAFGEPCGSFDENGEFIVSDQRVGLTCASFVVATLEQAGIKMVNREGWGPNADDANFFPWVIRALRGEIEGIPPADPRHVLAVERQIAMGAVRYRPIEVAGAATSDVIPVNFPDAIRLGDNLKRYLPDADAVPHYLR